jgi:hypothetical protein
VMFLGDCYYSPPLHLRTPDSRPDYEMCRRLLNYDYKLYVEAHSKPLTQTKLREKLPEKYR